MDLKEFRELTKNLPEDTEIIIDARGNPFGNCWSVLAIEATSVAHFGKQYPAIKLSEGYPDFVDADEQVEKDPEGLNSTFFIHPEFGSWCERNIPDDDSEAEIGVGIPVESTSIHSVLEKMNLALKEPDETWGTLQKIIEEEGCQHSFPDFCDGNQVGKCLKCEHSIVCDGCDNCEDSN